MPVFFTRARLKSKVGGRLRVFRGKIFTIFGAGRPPSGGLWELVGASERFLAGHGQGRLGSSSQMGS